MRRGVSENVSVSKHIPHASYFNNQQFKQLINVNINYERRQNIRKINVLKPTGYVMHQQFNIQQLYALPTLYLCVLYLPENQQRLVPLTA